ncbi:PKD domain-containing protein [Filimonas effusa]|uniref:T9SS type B sorting domain-containing protein n=1 Tax=Filimonas effusa TaxID=2508721 RepID=A0A4Q1D0Z5_9BACT|nr:PKD domain-containing protein [Filimonas effusa]RXK81399.1 T9SS type B sorting domain-containing protein [Filimonas effusa]
MKILILVLVLSFAATPLMANHLKGGWISYEYLGPGAASNTSNYSITINQYLDCNSTQQQIDQEVFLGIYNLDNNSLLQTLTVTRTATSIDTKLSFSPCINPVPTICYRIDKFTTTVTLPNNTNGYTLTVQRCCRIAGIVNVSNSSAVGVSYTNTIPGTVNGQGYYNNNSPVFAQRDTAVICYNSPFTFDFSATDIDGDSLVYRFTEGIIGGGQGNNQAKPNPPSGPPYGSVPYNGGFSGLSPLGAAVGINPTTGIISGKAPSQTGDYVVAVEVEEYRNGVKIGATRKEIHITVANCSLAAAVLDPEYISCDSYTNTFFNQSTNSNIASYLWDFGTGNPLDTSHAPTPTYTYKDTGVFTVKLKVTATGGCTDSTTTRVRVFPGFAADFNINGSCFQNPYTFGDATTTSYGVVDSWRWNFGDPATLADTSRLKNPQYKYGSPLSNISISLIATNSKGCIDTVTKTYSVLDKPLISLPFRDTLICSIDTLYLKATSSANATFAWTPGPYIRNASSATPYVFPKDTTTYVVNVNDNGCINSDSVKVNVLQAISVQLRPDTTICRTDSINLRPESHGLNFVWSPAAGLNNANIKYPTAAPLNDITYNVLARLGNCTANGAIRVKVVPYPTVVASQDTTLCFAQTVQLHAATVAAKHTWSPAASMLYTNTLHPLAGPQRTTTYVISVTDTLGCPKPVSDSILVTVIPQVKAFAGNDTAIVSGQPLQLNATGGTTYRWTPDIGINNRTLANPVVSLGEGIDSLVYTVRAFTPEGCYGDDDIKVVVFSTQPDIFVPTAFTPNADGKNDILRPILVGMKRLDFFRIYNRWGQLLFNTSEIGRGWDGTYEGSKQGSGTYVFVTQAVNYKDELVEKKGTIVLIR